METRVIRLRTHQKNIDRYEGLLKTKLSETERQKNGLPKRRRRCCNSPQAIKQAVNSIGHSSMPFAESGEAQDSFGGLAGTDLALGI
jgi:hypothetical protein